LKENMITQDEAKAVKIKAEKMFPDAAIAVVKFSENIFGLRVVLRTPPDRQLPDNINGVPVEFDVSGKPKKFL